MLKKYLTSTVSNINLSGVGNRVGTWNKGDTMPTPQYLTFEYAIRRPDGKLYTGSVHGDDRDWSTLGNIENPPFKYTEQGARKKIGAFQGFFKGCKVVRIDK